MTTTVREKPIIFDAESVRAILAGTKTQTRRVVKPQPINIVSGVPYERYDYENAKHLPEPEFRPIKNPYPVGTRLWVRETWAETEQAGVHPSDAYVVYRATDPDWSDLEGWRWNSPVFMPKWAARLWLEVVDVRVERVQEIGEEDAIAEGMDDAHILKTHPPSEAFRKPSAREAFRVRWDAINAHRPDCSWSDNPWVWVIEFKRVDTQGGAS